MKLVLMIVAVILVDGRSIKGWQIITKDQMDWLVIYHSNQQLINWISNQYIFNKVHYVPTNHQQLQCNNQYRIFESLIIQTKQHSLLNQFIIDYHSQSNITVQLNYSIELQNQQWQMVDIDHQQGLKHWIQTQLIDNCPAIQRCMLRKEGQKAKLQDGLYKVYVEILKQEWVLEEQDMVVMQYIVKQDYQSDQYHVVSSDFVEGQFDKLAGLPQCP